LECFYLNIEGLYVITTNGMGSFAVTSPAIGNSLPATANGFAFALDIEGLSTAKHKIINSIAKHSLYAALWSRPY